MQYMQLSKYTINLGYNYLEGPAQIKSTQIW